MRGGYGTPRLLDSIDFELLAANPKPFVGYSDITALHLAISRYAGFVTFHGPMLNADLLGTSNSPLSHHCSACCSGQQGRWQCAGAPAAYPLTTIEPGIASGRLLGGNLSMIAAVMGTPFELDAEGIILFIEDVNEPLYRIDRLLTHLRLAGKLAQVRGVLVGDVAGSG
jgi:muramoyltetrapeptide carboxypeptidase